MRGDGVAICAIPFLFLGLLTFGALQHVVSRPVAATPHHDVADLDGKAVSVAEPFRGSYFVGPPDADYLLATLRPDSLLGPKTFLNFQAPLMRRMFNSIGGMPSIPFGAGPPNMETLLALRPGAVFTLWFQAGAWRRLGLPVLSLGHSADPASALLGTTLFTQIVGDDQRGREIARRYEQMIRDTRHELDGLPGNLHPSVLALGFLGDGRMAALGGDNAFTQICRDAGATNASAHTWSPNFIDAEHVLALDPDIIVLRRTGYNQPLPSPQAFMADPRFRGLRAVRDGRVYQAPQGVTVFFLGAIDTPLMTRWIAELAHPDLPSELRATIRQTYGSLLHLDVSDKDLDAILGMTENKETAGYGRFAARN